MQSTSDKVDEGEFNPQGLDSKKKNTKTRRSVVDKEKDYLSQRIEKLHQELGDRDLLRQKTLKAINELRSNRMRVEEVIGTMSAERECLLREIERLQLRRVNSESIHHLKFREDEGDDLATISEEYMKDHEHLRQQAGELKMVYQAKCSDLIEYFSGSISQ